MLTLFHATSTRSHLIRFVLEESGMPHELVRLDVTKGEHKAASYLAVNPLGQLPAIIDGETRICEAAAIALYLSDKVPEKNLAPPIGDPRRASYTHWVVFTVATQLVALGKIALNTRFLPEAMRNPATAAEGRAAWKDIAPVIARATLGHAWLLGDTFSTADIMIGGSLWLAKEIGELQDPALRDYYERVSARPAFQRAFAD
jgi:glutathione S-transferase